MEFDGNHVTAPDATITTSCLADWRSVPLFPPEIYARILPKLGTKDLMNCRLVCRSWNLECRNIIISNGATGVVSKLKGINRIWEYIEFTKSEGFSGIVFPFRLICNKLSDGENKSPTEWDCPEREPERLPTNMEKRYYDAISTLQEQFGKECIAGASIIIPKNEAILYFRILSKLQVGLKCLELENWDHNLQLLSTREENIYFDSLEVLRCKTCMHVQLNPYYRSYYCYCGVLQYFPSCPNLKHLEICCWDMDILPVRTFAFARLKTLSIGYLGNSLSFLNAVRPNERLNRRYKLKRLEIRSMANHPYNETTISDLLLALSAELRSLTIPLGPHWSTYSCPLLPVLTHLVFPYDLHELANFRDFGFTPTNLPALTSIDIPMCCVLSVDEVFPKVTDITLRFGNRQFLGRSVPLFLETLLKVFPTARAFCILNECKENDSRVTDVLEAIFQHSGLSSIINELKIQSCYLTNLGRILNEIWRGNPACTTDGCQNYSKIVGLEVKVEEGKLCPTFNYLRKLTLEQTKENLTTPQSSQPMNLKLGPVSRYCPNLRELEISMCLLGDEIDSQACVKRIEEIEIEFPNWNILII